MSFFVYSIYNKNCNKFYIGQTKDLDKRIFLHNNKVFKGYTSKFEGSWKVIYKEIFDNRGDALKREKQLKSFQGRKFIKSIIDSEVAQR